MSKKNSNVILKSGFKGFIDLIKVYSNFKNKFHNRDKKSFLVAVSGGPDSLALVALTKALSYEKKIRFVYVLVNHNLRKNSKTEANQVKKLLKKSKINLYILDNKSEIKSNIQAEARNIRYELLKKFCIKKKLNTIITAHNLEDQVETFFIRLSRGSGLTGLSSMKTFSKIHGQISLFRPLLDTKKKILVKISKKTFGKFFKDPSNKNKKYLRTKIRDLKKPLEKSGIDYDKIFKSINNLASSKAILDEYYLKTFSNTTIQSANEISINLAKFKNLKNELKLRLINDCIKRIKRNYYGLRSKKVQLLIDNLEKKEFKRATLGGCIFSKKKDKINLKKE